MRRISGTARTRADSSTTDFALDSRAIDIALIAGRAHYEIVMQRLAQARRSIWIATANLKEVMVEGPRRCARSRDRYRSVLDGLDERASAGVELRLLHAGALELRQCPRVHFKTVIVDAEFCYVGSANWTGAGLGAKAEGRRNFELGFVSEDEDLIDQIQAMYESIWTGSQCAGCKLRKDTCEAPLDL
jgi:phosphatidylserine/phosphatidylglycerophosphate/cardiolipin synthase-like enzyme